jgi:hypothetical protein
LLTERPDGEIVNRAISVHHEIAGSPMVKFNVLDFERIKLPSTAGFLFLFVFVFIFLFVLFRFSFLTARR